VKEKLTFRGGDDFPDFLVVTFSVDPGAACSKAGMVFTEGVV
jgi:hypothetical protein